MRENESKIVNNYSEFAAARLGSEEDTPYYLGRSLYKYIDCGPWMVYLLDAPLLDKNMADELYYEDKEAGDLGLIDHIIGVKVGSIIEGSDVEIDPKEFMFPFDMKDFWEGVTEINDEASFYWDRDNSNWYFLKHNDFGPFSVKERCGDWEWNDSDEEIPQDIKDTVVKWINDGYCFQKHNEFIPVPGADGWTMCEYYNDAIY